MRITQATMYRTQLTGLNSSLERLSKTQEQLSTGKRLNRPSDSPVDTVTALRLRGDKAQLNVYADNIEDGLSRLAVTDTALGSATTMLNRVRTLTVAAANGTTGVAEREAMAKEIEQIADGLLQVANTQYADRAVFAGTAYDPSGSSNAFDPVTRLYVGNYGTASEVVRTVSGAPGTAGEMNVSINGADAFGTDLFTDSFPALGLFPDLVAKIRAGDTTQISAKLDDLDARMEQVLTARATVGAKVNRLETLQKTNAEQIDSAKAALSQVEETDFLEATMNLAIQSNGYQAALAATAKIITPSLADFLK